MSTARQPIDEPTLCPPDLTKYEKAAYVTLNEYRRRVWAELSQEQVDCYDQATAEALTLRDEVYQLQSKIQAERQVQEGLLMQLRQTILN